MNEAVQFTAEQREAVFTHDRDLIVTAGAGSGKTRVLVERFMALLDTNPDWSLPSIVAITFTEKAAREMRDRVRGAIEARIRAAAGAGDAAALDRWLDHQAALNRARIGTIHSLCAFVLRANPAQAEIDPGFEVLDENEARMLRDDAVQEALARLANSGHPAGALLVRYGVETVRAVLRPYAWHSAASEVIEALDVSPGDLLDRWRREWAALVQDLLDEARADADLRAALEWIQPGDLPPGDKLSAMWQLVHAQVGALLGDDPAPFADALAALAGGIKLNVGKKANWGEDGLAASKDTLRFIRERADELAKRLLPWPDTLDAEAAGWLLLWRDAIQLAAGVYADLKRDRAVLDFDDLESRARDLLRAYPDVAARHAAAFRHVLVDEFQDTNAAQRDIIYALSGVGQGDSGRLFVVGDPKQSIYAFRGADVSVFGDVRADLVRRGGAELPLSTSFRAHDRLVGAFNDLFGRILEAGSGPAGRYEVALGQPMEAFRPSDPARFPVQAQPVTVFAFPRPDKDAYPDFYADDFRRWEAWTLAHHMHNMVRRGVPVWDRDLPHDDLPGGAVVPDWAGEAGRGAYRPVQYGDMALLFQSMSSVSIYEDVFKAAGLPYVTVAGRGYFDRQEVRDLLCLLSALHNPADDLALAAALRSPLFGLSDNALFALRLALDEEGDPRPLWDTLFDAQAAPFFPADETGRRAFACETLLDLRALAGRATIADTLARALDLTGYAAVLTGLPDGARRRGNVDKLLALARESGRVSLGAFNAYARELSAREVREGEAAVEVEGAVTLMTVHSSKGLEFPVVILPDASWQRGTRRGVFELDPEAGAACRLPTDDPDADEPQPFAWAWAGALAERRDQAERRRLLYVGATRASEYLVVSGKLDRLGQRTWLQAWLDALGVTDEDLTPSNQPRALPFAWGECVLHVPGTPPPPDDLLPRAPDAALAWDDPAVRAMQPVPDVEPVLPPLLAEVPVDRLAPARALTATHIAKLGRAPYFQQPEQGYRVFRHSVLHDTPDPLRPLPGRHADDRALRRAVGEMVHRALQAWLLPGDTDPALLADRLRAYAWEADLFDEDQIALAVTQAIDLLRRFEASDLPRELNRARQVYRELPFVFRLNGREIHGVIDVLYFDRRGQWHVLDYKTAPVSAGGAYHNAKRYYLQVGVYAAAVEARVGQTPDAHLYYIHPGRLVYVKPDCWQPALAQLDDELRRGMDGGE
ncbi:MAG: UvrD-helicase domain-containing protein [Anaerolineae bacterium]|nr:UvrD-helicase domain-containing protein [Anaerolineae bacterium]